MTEQDKKKFNYSLEVVIYFIAVSIWTYSQYMISKGDLVQQFFVCAFLALIAPLIHIAIFSFFKTKRNLKVRKRILLGWFIAIIVISIVDLYSLYS